jgi:DNA replication protein DnaC
MIEKPDKDFYTSKVFKDRIKLCPGETKESRFKKWVAEKTTERPCCSRHPREQLVLNDHRSWPTEAYENEDYPWGARIIEPGAFHFTVELDCPACRCEHASCPPEFHQTGFGTFDISTPNRALVLGHCREFAALVKQHRRGFALFVGLPGTGKTRLACNIVRELETHDALYVRQGTLTIELRANYGRRDVYLHRRERRDEDDEDEEQPTLLETLQELRFLVLDEIGCTALGNDERLLLDELLKHRYDHGKPTILISNLPLNGVQEFLGDALFDRIRAAAGGGKFLLQFQGDSHRRATGEGYLRRTA